MKKLFMIRLENGDYVILQAVDEEEAIRNAGLRVDPAEYVAELQVADAAAAHLTMVESGFGPQNFTIRELDQFMCTGKLIDNGGIDLNLESEDTWNEVLLDYPEIAAAEEQEDVERAVVRERVRLLVK